MVLIPKQGREPNLAKSYSPISLLSLMLKTLKRFTNKFLKERTLTRLPLQESQHSYQRGKSTETALHSFVTKIESSLQEKQFYVYTRDIWFYHICWICKYQSKIQKHVSQRQNVTVFQAEAATVLDWVISCLRKSLMKEQITICTDSQAAVAALGASGTKLLLVADCIEKLTTRSEVNQVTIMWVPGHSGIIQ